ncbi:MAG: transposase zinc-binding domain-containing protein [Deltaproteobacteria bacterium]|nr:transposase zinc-binding domain-containing protein [Deltaproteobacteria bacterium]
MDRHLECGDLHHGFTRVKGRDCHHEYLLAFSCKRPLSTSNPKIPPIPAETAPNKPKIL